MSHKDWSTLEGKENDIYKNVYVAIEEISDLIEFH